MGAAISAIHSKKKNLMRIIFSLCLENDRRVEIGIDDHVDARGPAAVERALQRREQGRRILDALAMRAEDAREGRKIHVVVVHGESAAAVVLLLEGALVAEAAVVVY